MTAGDCRASNWIRHNSIDCIIGKHGQVISRRLLGTFIVAEAKPAVVETRPTWLG